jgi:GAF domain-containing protein
MTEPESDQPDAAPSPAGMGAPSFTEALQRIVDLACSGLRGCSMAGITLLEREGPTTAVATSRAAARIDAIQYRHNRGPCLDSYRFQVVTRIEATDTDPRWPEFSREAAAEGIRSTLSFPLVVRGDGIGALNLYSSSESGFDERDEEAGAIFAEHASLTLANVRAFWHTEALRKNLEDSLSTRGIIDQAIGVLMAREGLSADDAFEILRRASQRENRKVLDLAKEIVNRTENPRTRR